jgi:hypothetical protein
MSETSASVAPAPAPTAAGTVQKYAVAVFGEIAKLSQSGIADYAAIQENPAYAAALGIGASLVSNELSASGVPVAEQTNIARAVAATVDALAALHPAIKTP